MSSWLTNLTVVPTATVNSFGENVKLSIMTTFGVLRRDRAERQQRSDEGTQQHGNDQGATGAKSSCCGAQMLVQILHLGTSDQPASVLSTKASGLLPRTTVTVESPSMERS